MSNKVGLEFVMKLKKLFEEKKWNLIENNDSVYENLCALSENLSGDDDAHNLFLLLIDKYQWMSYNEYSVQVNILLKKIFIDSKKVISKAFLFPLIKPEDENKNKSGNSISYMIKCNKPYFKSLKNIKIQELTVFDDLKSLKLRENEKIILVDDYVGSGETLRACIDKIREINESLIDNLLIGTIAIQKETIKDFNVDSIFYSMIVSKGITDAYSSPEREKHLQTMKSLEKKLISGSHFSLGYEQSEGLVTMLRTPDNTFPIFWHEYKKKFGLFPPFPRE